MFGDDHKIKRLEQVPLLAHCSARDLRSIASRGDIVRVRKGDAVRPTGRERSFVVVLDGKAERVDGIVLEPGDTYGAVDLLRRKRTPDDVRMITDGDVLIIGARAFSGLFYTVPSFALAVSKELAARAS